MPQNEERWIDLRSTATVRLRMTEIVIRVMIQRKFYEIGERSIEIDMENKREQGMGIRKQQ